MKKRSAFSLLELAVVLLVIGIITAGITKGASIIRNGRVSAAKSITVNSKINEISGMIAWYETTMEESFERHEAVDNAQTSNWFDISPEAISEHKNTLTRSANDDVVYRTSGINSLPSLQFSGSGTISLSSFFQGSFQRFTICTVFQPTITMSGSYLTVLDSYAGSATNYAIAINNSNLKITEATSHNIAKTFTQSEPYVVCSYFNKTDLAKSYVNQTSSETGSYTGSVNDLSGLTVGADKNIASGFTGFISEIIIFNRIISEEERKSVMGYLGQKYNVRVAGAF